MFEAADNILLANLIWIAENQDVIKKRLLENTNILWNIKNHDWHNCDCPACKDIRELVEVEIMDEDSPNNMLTNEEHILLFNKVKVKNSNTSTDELIATRQLMKKAIAVIRTHVQAKTVILNERRVKASREEKAKIHAADKLYSPALRPEEKADDKEIKMLNEINKHESFKNFMKALPTPQYKAVIQLCKQLGVIETMKTLKFIPPEPNTNDEK